MQDSTFGIPLNFSVKTPSNRKSLATIHLNVIDIKNKIMQINQKKLTELTDQELLAEAKKKKSNSIINGFLIGFLAGIIFYSIVKNTYGFLTLIPLFFAYKLINNSKYNHQELEEVLKERKLK